MVADPPPGAIVVPRAPLLDLMPKLDAVLTHGGLNTACEALSHGVPLVVAPIKSDQPINANQVAAAGAGVRVKFHRAPPEQLRAASARCSTTRLIGRGPRGCRTTWPRPAGSRRRLTGWRALAASPPGRLSGLRGWGF